jgi:hypothetical protein
MEVVMVMVTVSALPSHLHHCVMNRSSRARVTLATAMTVEAAPGQKAKQMIKATATMKMMPG